MVNPLRTHWPAEIKDQAKSLRTQGFSYGQLSKKLGIARSTLHQWVRGIKRPEKFTLQDRIRWIKEIQPLGADMNRRKRREFLEGIDSKIRMEMKKINLSSELEMVVLAMLYWTEGAKGRGVLKFANTDPRLVALFLKLLRRNCQIDEGRLRLRLHLHDYHDEDKLKEFWSNLLSIPLSQFHKTYRKERSKNKTFRKNFGGICFLSYNSVHLKDELLMYGFVWGEKIAGKIVAPIA